MFARYKTEIKVNGFSFKDNPKFSNLGEVFKQIDSYVNYLRSLKTYNDRQVEIILCGLLQIYNDWAQNRPDIAQRLVETHFANIMKHMAEYYNNMRAAFVDGDDLTMLYYYYLQTAVVWNYTDVSARFGKSIIEAGLIQNYAFNLSFKPYIERMDNICIGKLIGGSLSILHNIIRLCPEYKQHFRDNKVDQVVEPFLKHENYEVKCDAILLMSAVINEDEAEKLEDTGAIAYMIEHISESLKDPGHSTEAGFSLLELLLGLARIAVNDSNKQTIVDSGALPLLVESMSAGSDDEQESAAKTLWTLCFVESSKEKVKQEPNCVDTLHTLSKSSNVKVKSSAEGALWEIKGMEAHPAKPSSDVAQDKHIFISYNHGHGEIVHQIKDQLKEDGYTVWIDIERMHGSINDTIATAIESAAVVLICLSEKYKLSASCRSEAKYAKRRNLPIVPLMMQRRYQPDGWLGMIIEDEFYVDFAKFDFRKAYGELCKQLVPHLCQSKHLDVVDGKVFASDVPHLGASDVPHLGALPPLRPPSPPTNHTTHYAAAKWTNQMVQQWITDCQLRSVLNTKLQCLLDAMDGEAMVAFCWMKNKVPEYFIKHLSEQYNTDMLQMVFLIKALNKLP